MRVPDDQLAGPIEARVEFDSGPLAGRLWAETTFHVQPATNLAGGTRAEE
ncbi:MAG TPA: hypothetical protein VFW87_12315 [Pirellulales bacterium]|nr:hypothetical protein [Pirellulales bacterium]